MTSLSDLKENIVKEQEERLEYVKNIGIEYRFGCYEEKRADSCHLLAEYMEAIEQNSKIAYHLFKENCDARKYAKSCYKYATYLLAGKECEPSLSAMIKPLEISCAANQPRGCRMLALVHWNGEPGRPANSKLAEKYMKKACELEDAEACWLLSTWYMGPDTKMKLATGATQKEIPKDRLGSLPRNMEKAIEYGKIACDLAEFRSCANVARIYKLGDGVPKDLDKAKEFSDRAKQFADSLRRGDSSAGFTG
ncbi:Protein ZK20.4 a [Aphelenchoides avenae]|nr:Protein ZK20.4 a [Aphelenchus avenae]